jgi:polyisoprenoid-binding protein YceI
MKKSLVLTLLTLMCVVPLISQDSWQLDRSHSRVEFTVTHMLISEVTGRFTDFDVSMTSNGTDLTGGSIEATIRTASVNTDNEGRDEELRAGSFFQSDSFPVATFRSTAIEKTGENTYRVAGDLTIRERTKPISMDVTMLGTITDGRGRVKTGWKGLTSIDRFDYNVLWDRKLDSGGLVVSKDVAITLRMEMVKKSAEAK